MALGSLHSFASYLLWFAPWGILRKEWVLKENHPEIKKAPLPFDNEAFDAVMNRVLNDFCY